MPTDYDTFYRDNRHGLGAPTQAFVDFFQTCSSASASVLDAGCGQGRDALFIARLGHRVCAVDASPAGIRDLRRDAEREGLSIDTHITDIRDFKTRRRFDVIVIDRLLHMLPTNDAQRVFQRLLSYSKRNGHVLIADEKSNLPALEEILHSSRWQWTKSLHRGGLLFVQRQ